MGFLLLCTNCSPGVALHSASCRASLFGEMRRESEQPNTKLVINVSWEPKPSNNKNNSNDSTNNSPKLSPRRGEQIDTLQKKPDQYRGAIGHLKCNVLGSRQESGMLETGSGSKETGCKTK